MIRPSFIVIRTGRLIGISPAVGSVTERFKASAVRITMKDGRIITGRRLNEDTFTVQVIDDKERLHSLVKSEMRNFIIDTKPLMPSYAGKLTEDEVADVVAYLLTLRGQ